MHVGRMQETHALLIRNVLQHKHQLHLHLLMFVKVIPIIQKTAIVMILTDAAISNVFTQAMLLVMLLPLRLQLLQQEELFAAATLVVIAKQIVLLKVVHKFVMV
jgi:hypothetical protein